MQIIKDWIIGNVFIYKIYLRYKLLTDSNKNISKFEISEYINNEPIVIEIGAHVGSDTVEMAVLWPKGKIYAFEPIKSVFERLYFKTKNFKNIKIFQAAITDKQADDSAQMYVSDNSGCSSSLLKPKDHLLYYPGINFSPETMQITTILLSNWLKITNIKVVDLIWIDAQGMELNIFKSLGDKIRDIKFIYTEVSLKEFYEGSGSYEEIKEYLSDNGFILVKDDLSDGQLMGNALFKNNN